MRRRLECPGMVYHVIQRGNNREAIFRDDADYYRYLNIMAKTKAEYDFLLLGYVLMGNHYHLLIRTGEIPLQKIIFYQNMHYSRYFNKRHSRSGHLYGSRYKALPVMDDQYLFSVLRYIHWNPCKANLCSKPNEFAWSSDSYYRNDSQGIVDVDLIYKILSANRTTGQKIYTDLMKNYEDIDYDAGELIGENEIYSDSRRGNSFRKKGGTGTVDRPLLDQILKDTGIDTDGYRLIKTGSRQRRFSEYKSHYFHNALSQGYTLEEIGKNIGISAVAVSKQVNK